MYFNEFLLGLSEPKLICALLAANSQAGNLSRVAMDWSYLPKEFHRMGLEAILQSSVFGGLLGTINALETVHSIGVDQVWSVFTIAAFI